MPSFSHSQLLLPPPFASFWGLKDLSLRAKKAGEVKLRFHRNFPLCSIFLWLEFIPRRLTIHNSLLAFKAQVSFLWIIFWLTTSLYAIFREQKKSEAVTRSGTIGWPPLGLA